MEFQLTVLVTTADRTPIPGVAVTGRGDTGTLPPATTGPDGRFSFGLVKTPISLKFAMKNYVWQTLLIDFKSKEATLVWNDPGSTVLTRKGNSSTELIVTTPLGRMACAAIAPVSEQQQIKANAVAKAPELKAGQAHITQEPFQHTWAADAEGHAVYSFMTPLVEKQTLRFWAATQETLVRQPEGKTKSKGWGQFMAQPTDLKPDFESQFFYVEWTDPEPGSQQPRYLVALWRPRSKTLFGAAHVQGSASPDIGAEARDVVVFLTPPTIPTKNGFAEDKTPYRGNYPYAATITVEKAVIDKGVTRIVQEYLHLADRFMFQDSFLAAQMMAAKKDALLIFPIQPSGHWEEMAQLGGISRLVTEALLWEHRQVPLPKTERGWPLIPVDHPENFTPLLAYQPPPLLRYAILSAFSTSMGVVKEMMRESMVPRPNTPAKTFDDELKNPYLSPPDTFLVAWREVWDVDGSSNALAQSGWRNWARICRSWVQDVSHIDRATRKTDRAIRCYHSQFTVEPRNAELLKNVAGTPVPRWQPSYTKKPPPPLKDVSGGLYHEWHGDQGSVVWLSKEMLEERSGSATENFPKSKGLPPDTVERPTFWIPKDDHHAVPQIAIAHAAVNSGLRKLEVGWQ